jgi:FHS family glucose/mannose:H+ symporter-like MFS transporter
MYRSPQLLIHIAFVLTGVVTTLLGPLIPILSARWLLDDKQAGYLFTAQFLGSTIGVLASNRLIRRLGFLRSLIVGLSIMAFGVAAVPIGAWEIGLASVSCYGFALGITIPTANLMISELNPTRRAAALNLLNFAWGLGAVTGPPVIALSAPSQLSLPMIVLSALLGSIAVALARFPEINTAGEDSADRAEEGASGSVSHLVWRNPLTLLIAAMAFLYVGMENSIAGWVAYYALRLDLMPIKCNTPRSFWAFLPSGFWLALSLGRALAPAFLRYLSDDDLLLIGLLAAVGGAAFMLAATTLPGLLIGVLTAGFGLAPVFPTVLAIKRQRLGTSAQKVAGITFALAGLGGATIPWTVGLISTQFGSLRTGLIIPLISGLAMLCLQMLLRRNAASG